MNGIIDGYPDGTFHPVDSINFVEAAKIIGNVFSLNIKSYQTGEFWFRSYVQSLSDLYAIPTNVKRLNQTLSRADMAQIVYRLKVDSKEKPNMVFDSAKNRLTQRSGVTTPTPYVAPNSFGRPSRRSIIEAAEKRNILRTAR